MKLLIVMTWMCAVAAALPAHDAAAARPRSVARLEVRSPAFAPHGAIPSEYTADGPNHSPPLAWSGAPARTRSFAIIVDDLDAPDPKAPKLDWVHWVIYDLPRTTDSLAAGADPKRLPRGTRPGLNDWKAPGWRGPAPPIGEHRYFFRVHALDIVLPDLGRPSRAQLEKAMRGHILASGELIGTYAHR